VGEAARVCGVILLAFGHVPSSPERRTAPVSPTRPGAARSPAPESTPWIRSAMSRASSRACGPRMWTLPMSGHCRVTDALYCRTRATRFSGMRIDTNSRKTMSGIPPSAQDAHKPKVHPLTASARCDRSAIVQLHQFVGTQCVPRLGPCKLADKHPENCSAEDSAGRSASGNACDDFGIERESGAAIQSRLGPPATTHTATASRME
jgi:hypothetical protein